MAKQMPKILISGEDVPGFVSRSLGRPAQFMRFADYAHTAKRLYQDPEAPGVAIATLRARTTSDTPWLPDTIWIANLSWRVDGRGRRLRFATVGKPVLWPSQDPWGTGLD
jgi:hypothetical protein